MPELRRSGSESLRSTSPLANCASRASGSSCKSSLFKPWWLCSNARAKCVTREELQKRLWPGGTFVDFDRGLNKAINRVREALGDDADNPRFIETVPQRGYRFLAQVETPFRPSRLHRRLRRHQFRADVPRRIERRAFRSRSAGGLICGTDCFYWVPPFAFTSADGLSQSRCCHWKICRATPPRNTSPTV